ncbi:MAG: PcfJ domain-containing protein [Lachnospiraceae bacterium]|nr:PcfJ domain-containing protein [Lachnospiraceae bacterium]
MDRQFFVMNPDERRCYCSHCGVLQMQDVYNIKKHMDRCTCMSYGRDICERLIPDSSYGYRVTKVSDTELAVEICTPMMEFRRGFVDRYVGASWNSLLKVIYHADDSKKVEEIYNNSSYSYDLWLSLIRNGKMHRIQTQRTVDVIREVFPNVIDIYSLQMFDFIYRHKGYQRKVKIREDVKEKLLKPMRGDANVKLFRVDMGNDEEQLILRTQCHIGGECIVVLFCGDDVVTNQTVNLDKQSLLNALCEEFARTDINTNLLKKFAQRYPECGIKYFLDEKHLAPNCFFVPLLAANYHVGLEMLCKMGLTYFSSHHEEGYYMETDPNVYTNVKQLFKLPVKVLKQMDTIAWDSGNLYGRIMAMIRAAINAYKRNPAFLQGNLRDHQLDLIWRCFNAEIYLNELSDGQWLRILRYLPNLDDDEYLMYRDYLYMGREMGDFVEGLTPKYLKPAHDKAVEIFNERRNYYMKQRFREAVGKEAYTRLANEGLDYQICCPKSADDLYEEGKAMRNCVASYKEEVARGRSKIYFLRKNEEPDKSFGTIEVCGRRLIQAKAFANQKLPEHARRYVRSWCKEYGIRIDTRDV